MGLSYFYTFSAPKSVTAAQLEKLLKKVEREAKRAGFRPTLVLNASFVTPEERQFCVFRRISDSDSNFIRTVIRFISDAAPI